MWPGGVGLVGRWELRKCTVQHCGSDIEERTEWILSSMSAEAEAGPLPDSSWIYPGGPLAKRAPKINMKPKAENQEGASTRAFLCAAARAERGVDGVE